jgi:hypothetical protein
MLHVSVHAACPCPCYMSKSILDVMPVMHAHVNVGGSCLHAVCLCCVAAFYAACTYCMSMLYFHAAHPWYMSMLHALATCPCLHAACHSACLCFCPFCMSLLHTVSLLYPCYSTFRLNIHPALFPYCMYMPPCCMSFMQVHAAYLRCIFILHVPVPMLHAHAACSTSTSLLLVHAAFPCCLSMLHVHTACPCCMSDLLIHAACPCCLSMLHGHSACPCCLSILLFHAACPCCLSILHVHFACSFCIQCCMPTLHLHAPCLHAAHVPYHMYHMNELENVCLFLGLLPRMQTIDMYMNIKINTECPCCLSMQHIHFGYPILHANAACLCFLSMPMTMSPCCMYELHS